MEMPTVRYVTVIAGISGDEAFNHLCFVAQNLAETLPNFNFKSIDKSFSEWKPWLHEICKRNNWSHNRSPIIWREIGVTQKIVTYIGGAGQFWELLHAYYNITSQLRKQDLQNLQSDLLFIQQVHNKIGCLELDRKCCNIIVIGAGRSLCLELIPQLVMTKELWMSHGVLVNLYDEPGCYFKLKKIVKDIEGVGGGLRAAKVVESISDGLENCDILIYLDEFIREEQEGIDTWLYKHYKHMESLSKDLNRYAPSNIKVIFCSTGPTCFCANVVQALVKKIPKTNIVSTSAHYGLELIFSFVKSLGFKSQKFGCPPVWGYLGVSRFVDVCNMVHKYDVYRPNERASKSNKNSSLPLGVKHSELRWFFYMAHDKNPYKHHYKEKALAQYQVGRVEDFQKCRAICDLLKLWYSDKVTGDEIISLGISSNGTFGIPEGLVFSQPVSLETLENKSRAWVPFPDFPLPNIPPLFFRNLIETAVLIQKKFICSQFEEDSVKSTSLNFEENE